MTPDKYHYMQASSISASLHRCESALECDWEMSSSHAPFPICLPATQLPSSKAELRTTTCASQARTRHGGIDRIGCRKDATTTRRKAELTAASLSRLCTSRLFQSTIHSQLRT
jgi:hypothetical protein